MKWGETRYTLPAGRHANLEEKSDSPDIQTSAKLLVNKDGYNLPTEGAARNWRDLTRSEHSRGGGGAGASDLNQRGAAVRAYGYAVLASLRSARVSPLYMRVYA